MSKSVELADLIRARAGGAAPEYGLILGSGLGHLSGAVDGVAIPYDDLPGFPHAGVSGHVPQLVIGDLEGARVAVFARSCALAVSPSATASLNLRTWVRRLDLTALFRSLAFSLVRIRFF